MAFVYLTTEDRLEVQENLGFIDAILMNDKEDPKINLTLALSHKAVRVLKNNIVYYTE
jgi:hypothetical protein